MSLASDFLSRLHTTQSNTTPTEQTPQRGNNVITDVFGRTITLPHSNKRTYDTYHNPSRSPDAMRKDDYTQQQRSRSPVDNDVYDPETAAYHTQRSSSPNHVSANYRYNSQHRHNYTDTHNAFVNDRTEYSTGSRERDYRHRQRSASPVNDINHDKSYTRQSPLQQYSDKVTHASPSGNNDIGAVRRKLHERQAIEHLSQPTACVVLRGLSPNTDESTLHNELTVYFIKSITVIRNKQTGTSKCVAFVTFNSVSDSIQFIHDNLNKLQIDGKSIWMDYAEERTTATDNTATTHKRMTQPVRPHGLAESFIYNDQTHQWYDIASGYVYLPIEHLYYHKATNTYGRIDTDTKQFIQTDERGVAITEIQNTTISNADTSKKQKHVLQTTVKTINSTSDTTVEETKPRSKLAFVFKSATPSTSKASIMNAVSAFSNKTQPTTSNAVTVTTAQPTIDTTQSTPQSPITDTDRKWLDFNKMACMLCQRGFKSIEIMIKHANQSELHRTNLAKQFDEYSESNVVYAILILCCWCTVLCYVKLTVQHTLYNIGDNNRNMTHQRVVCVTV